jgi:hypothetical protein
MYKAVSSIKWHWESTSFMYLEDKDYHEISETLGISRLMRVKMNELKGNWKNIKSWIIEVSWILKDWKKKWALNKYQN